MAKARRWRLPSRGFSSQLSPWCDQMGKSAVKLARARGAANAAPLESDIEKLPASTMDERGRTVAWITRTVHRLYDAESQKILDRRKIPIAHWYYLRVLAERGELNQLELSKRVGIASTTAVPALDNMEKRGLVKRVRDPLDRRKYFVRLTDKGRAIVDELLPEVLAMIDKSIGRLTAGDMRTFWKVTHEMERALTGLAGANKTTD
jgi:MarR family transcriptional regulator, organic hydroperoxide resistance regulator